ncbi:MAG: Asp-tRNA(Asn)/Glu-tRNA(Gln) amidotransferase subunit GatB [Deltaproteobacteria bacterium]|nr:Asp-tRNA(Asn)/Glu-tRNA(Gln) amidotransferase subunit GatB [Deltaproteobacteria bacterium]
MSEFEPVIGLEIHLQLNSRAKLFCRAENRFTDQPNVNVDFYTFGLPGVLPVLNREPVEKAVTLALALACQINEISTFDRKHYFYPDLPKGYQITQFYRPFAVLGVFSFPLNGRIKQVPIKSIQLEEDAGKSIHDKYLNKSLVDLNRAGIPLVEVVTDPCFKSSEEAAEFVKFFRNLAKYLNISEANLEQGSLRCDVNVSIRPRDSLVLGTRVEIKNLNSFKFLTQAINYEIARQIKEVREGRDVFRETRGFNPETGTTYSLRRKEELSDYRYMPDPDLPPLRLSSAFVDGLREKLPILPTQTFLNLTQNWAVSPDDAIIVSYDRRYTTLLNHLISRGVAPKVAVNFLVNDIQGLIKERGLESSDLPFPVEKLTNLLLHYQNNKISSRSVKNLLERLLRDPTLDIEHTISSENLLIASSEEKVHSIVDEVLKSFPDVVKEILSEEDKTKTHVKKKIGFLTGQVLAKSSNIDPKIARKSVEMKLGIKSE